MISLKNRLMATYGLFVSLALLGVTILINRFTGSMFETLVKASIQERSEEILRAVGDQYNPQLQGFDMISLEAMGMYFVHEGYIITLEDPDGRILWNARSMDMQHCAAVINEITRRMEERHQVHGSLQDKPYLLQHQGVLIGTLKIQSYGPFFYSEGESRFLSSLNRLLCIAGLVFTGLSILISWFLAATIAKPLVKAGEAARFIAEGNRRISLSAAYKTRELHDLAQSINSLAQELAEGERRQKQLTADIAHELRTPLTCLQGNMEAMLDGIWEPTPERLASCHEEIIRLSKLTADLTALEWEDLVLHRRAFDLSQLVQTAAEQFQSAAHEKGLTLIQNLSAGQIVGDYDRLKQVVMNLLANGIKYTDQGTITIGVYRTSRWNIRIADTGIGVSPEDLPHIFERFYRSDKSRNRDTGGAGIGLTIAAAIVKAHGGTITASSEAGRGSVFQVELPL